MNLIRKQNTKKRKNGKDGDNPSNGNSQSKLTTKCYLEVMLPAGTSAKRVTNLAFDDSIMHFFAKLKKSRNTFRDL